MNLIARSLLGFLISPLAPSIAYTWNAWGDAFIPFIYLSLLAAYIIALTILAPLYILMIRKKFYNIYTGTLTGFLAVFLLFLIFFIFSGSRYDELIVGSTILVESGALTTDGYRRIFMSSAEIGAWGALGAVFFTIVVRGSNALDLSYIQSQFYK